MTATEHRATEAWAKVVREKTVLDVFAGTEPMPPAIALDYVQDECGDRDDAVMALLAAAGQWLLDTMPVAREGDEFDSACRADAADVAAYIEAESGMARVFFSHIEERYERWVNYTGNALVVDGWRLWIRGARRALDLCRAVVDAA